MTEMRSCNYQVFFAEWKNWSEFKTEPMFNGINGVYAYRLTKVFGRLRGESSLLYIGKCDQNSVKNKRPGIWHRLRNYLQPKNGGACRRLQELINLYGEKAIEYSYVQCNTPRSTEKKLLRDYIDQHHELPPLNRSH